MKANLVKILVVLTTIFFSSCQVEPADPALLAQVDSNNNSNGAANFKVDFDSQTWTANTIQAIVNGDYVAITGMKSNGEFFQITIPHATVGTYTLNANSTNFGLIYSAGSGNVPYIAADDSSGVFANFPNYTNTAQIIISSIDTANKKISGSFKFTGVRFASGSSTTVETKVFTNGSFTNLSYTANVSSPANNSFFAKLDGADFVPTNINGFKMSGFISLIGRKGNIENIGLVIPDNVTSGTVLTFDALSSTTRGQYVDASSNVFGGNGTITVTTHDVTNKRVKGTFSFTASTLIPPIINHPITQGTFDITYQ